MFLCVFLNILKYNISEYRHNFVHLFFSACEISTFLVIFLINPQNHKHKDYNTNKPFNFIQSVVKRTSVKVTSV